MMIERVIPTSVNNWPGKCNQHQKRKQENADDLIGHKYHKQINIHGPVDIKNPSNDLEYQIF